MTTEQRPAEADALPKRAKVNNTKKRHATRARAGYAVITCAVFLVGACMAILMPSSLMRWLHQDTAYQQPCAEKTNRVAGENLTTFYYCSSGGASIAEADVYINDFRVDTFAGTSTLRDKTALNAEILRHWTPQRVIMTVLGIALQARAETKSSPKDVRTPKTIAILRHRAAIQYATYYRLLHQYDFVREGAYQSTGVRRLLPVLDTEIELIRDTDCSYVTDLQTLRRCIDITEAEHFEVWSIDALVHRKARSTIEGRLDKARYFINLAQT